MAADFIGILEKRWRDSLKGRKRSTAAGGMAGLLLGFWANGGVDYPGRTSHTREVLAYLRGCTRVKWQVEDLERVCWFLHALPENRQLGQVKRLFEQFVEKGYRTFRQSPFFQCATGELELNKGPMMCDVSLARASLERAIQLAEKAGGSENAGIAAVAKKVLNFLQDVTERPMGGIGGSPFDFVLDEFFEDDDEEDEDEEDEDFDDGFRGDGPRELISEMCESLGLNPNDIFAQAEALFAGTGRRMPKPPGTRSKKKRK